MLESIYREALAACAPDALIQRLDRRGFPRTVVAIGKCAGALLDGFGDCDAAFAAIPSGYPRPKRNAIVVEGGHPEMTADSFRAGKALLEFVDAHDAITFLISGGGSACVEWPLEGHSEGELIETNARLIRSGAPIGEINRARKQLSAIKGGRLGKRVRRSVTLVYSDVSTGALADVASGPTVGSGEVHLIADNSTLTATAARIAKERGLTTTLWPSQIETDVERAAHDLAEAVLDDGILIAGGEPTVTTRGDGRGGRCSELAVRFALAARHRNVTALFGSSDGVDGNSGAAGVIVDHSEAVDAAAAERELSRSNSMAIIPAIGRAMPLCPSGNNLRDIYLLARS